MLVRLKRVGWVGWGPTKNRREKMVFKLVGKSEITEM